MKKTIYIILIISFLTLFGCSKTNNTQIENNTENNTETNVNKEINKESSINKESNNIIGDIKQNNLKKEVKIKQGEVKYNKEEKTLYIGSTTIKKGLPSNFPFDDSVYRKAKVYINSNVKDYIFYTIDGTQDVKSIGQYYLEIFNKLGYKRVLPDIKLPKGIKGPSIIDLKNDLHNLEFVLKDKKGVTVNTKKQYPKKVSININDRMPENLKKGLGLKGMYIEIYYNKK